MIETKQILMVLPEYLDIKERQKRETSQENEK